MHGSISSGIFLSDVLEDPRNVDVSLFGFSLEVEMRRIKILSILQQHLIGRRNDFLCLHDYNFFNSINRRIIDVDQYPQSKPRPRTQSPHRSTRPRLPSSTQSETAPRRPMTLPTSTTPDASVEGENGTLFLPKGVLSV